MPNAVFGETLRLTTFHPQLPYLWATNLISADRESLHLYKKKEYKKVMLA